ncbi:MAG TPA: family 43 glycosylhydrolase [Prolixibacteraceae bacterium]|nr:family 43 glycosylhydrolase [Prolixibacteraceae bacterium]
MKRIAFAFLLSLFLFGCKTQPSTEIKPVKTVCNPVDISYRFCLDKPSRREAADPTIVWYKDRYFLFASKSGGYWHSKDLSDWTFVETDQIPVEEYAPAAVVMGDTIYFLASSNEKSTLYKSTDPLSGKWSVAVEKLEIPVWDPTFLFDDDQRLYLYWGCSNVNPLYGVEVDYKNNFSFKGKPAELLHSDIADHGWEVPGDYNTLTKQSPWIEGTWLNKINGKYYLQYAGPGTEYKSYCDGVYVSESPLGPYTLQEHNPFAYKPEGFAAGAGHGSTFADRYGNFWHIGTMTISQKHMFERRLGLFPVFLDETGTLYCNTKYGDYPYQIPQRKIKSFEEIFSGWMLLSYHKKVEVPSSVDSLPAGNMVDENIRTYWAAASGSASEYAILDLEDHYDVFAIQVNFAEHNTDIYGRKAGLRHRYTIEYSNDKANWQLLIDQSLNESDHSHDYTQLKKKVNCRFLRIKNLEVPGGNFAISGFRVFGKGQGAAPEKVAGFKAIRNNNDRKSVTLTWEKTKGANGYNISYGVGQNQLYQNYIVYDDTTVTINSLNANLDYYFTIESFNENGISKSEKTVRAE